MPPKAVATTLFTVVTALEFRGDTSIRDDNLQVVIIN